MPRCGGPTPCRRLRGSHRGEDSIPAGNEVWSGDRRCLRYGAGDVWRSAKFHGRAPTVRLAPGVGYHPAALAALIEAVFHAIAGSCCDNEGVWLVRVSSTGLNGE